MLTTGRWKIVNVRLSGGKRFPEPGYILLCVSIHQVIFRIKSQYIWHVESSFLSTVEWTIFFKMIVSRAVLASWWSKTDPPEVIREVSTSIFMLYIQTCLRASKEHMGQFLQDGENGQNVAFSYFLELCCDQTVWFFRLFSAVVKRFQPGHSKNAFV